MSVIAMPAGVCGANSGPLLDSLIEIITDLGLTTNLKLCLDAGDSNSYNPAVQTEKWLDTSGNGYDFTLGSSGVDVGDPTFNGNAGGRSSAEYFSLDGGDYFAYDAVNESWMQALHNDGALWSMFMMLHLPSLTSDRILLSDKAGSGSTRGIAVIISSGTLYVQLADTVGANLTTVVASSATAGVWGAVGIGITENGGAGASSYLKYGGTTGTFNGSNTRVSTGDSSYGFTIGAYGDKTSKLPLNSRIACLAVWQGTALTTTNLSDIYNAIKGRFGL